jgi:hypothetical protein
VAATYDPVELIKRRFDALKKLQIKSAEMEAQFYEELYLLECRYNTKSKPLKDLRKSIIMGSHEPTDEECKLDSGIFINKNSVEFKEKEENRDQLAKSISALAAKNDNIKGIPEFWLTVFKKVGLVAQLIEEADEPVLKYLYDLDVDLHDKKPYYFRLNFHFLPNEYFKNSVLTKTYKFKIELNENEPFIFEAPETHASIGCEIQWKKGKNVTKRQGGAAVVDKNEKLSEDQQQRRENDDKQGSFFNFFDTIDFQDKKVEELTCEEEADLAIDYEVGYTFKEKVIPKAILYYLGEITDDNDEGSDLNDDDEEDEDDFNLNEIQEEKFQDYEAATVCEEQTKPRLSKKLENLNKN